MSKKIEHCQKIAATKRKQTIDKVIKAILELLQEEQSLSLSKVIEKAGVSQSWIYNNPDLKELINYLSECSFAEYSYFKQIDQRLEIIEKKITD